MRTSEESTPKSPKVDFRSPLQGEGGVLEITKKSFFIPFKPTFFRQIRISRISVFEI